MTSICLKICDLLLVETVGAISSVNQSRFQLYAFVMVQLSCCSLIWMFHDINLNNKVYRIHERAVGIPYKDNASCFENITNG